MTLLTRYDRDT